MATGKVIVTLRAQKEQKAESTIHYLCDHRACEICRSEATGCQHTSDIRHAKSFENAYGLWMEAACAHDGA